MNWSESTRLDEFSIFYCHNCKKRFKFDRLREEVIPLGLVDYEQVSEHIPEFDIASRVFLDDKQHRLFLEQGIVTALSHLYVRVMFVSTDKNINGTQLRLPHHVLKPLPRELRADES